MAEGKWIEGLTPGTPAVDAARTVLAARIGVVRHYFPLAVHGAGEVENVHQLRVSSRRAAAALRLFRPLAAKKPFRRLRARRVRAARRAGGALCHC